MSVKVIKRNGELEQFSVDKIHKVIDLATQGIQDVNISDIEFNANLSIKDGISTKEIHDILIRSANDLISEDSPNYQYVAARLLLYSLRKDVWGESEPPRLYEHIKKCVDLGIYDGQILELYSESEIHKINKMMDHSKDEKFTYSGLQQLVDKYLLKNRQDGTIYETPQFAYIMIAMWLFSKYKNGQRLEYVKKAYNFMSDFKINLPTPIMSGVRTPIRQFASCVLCEVDDNMSSIFSSITAVGYYTAKRGGIGIGMGRIRPIGSQIRHGEVVHTGLLPFLKVFESTVKSCQQSAIRGGSATVAVPFFHPEIMDVMVLKNNAGTDDNRIRRLDYSIQFCKLFYDRVIKDEYITLFSSHECKKLFDLFGREGFDEEYVKQEANKKLKFRKKIKARELIECHSRERLETGRIYAMNIDHANSNSSWHIPLRMSQLCQEVILPTKPLQHIDDENAEIGICILSAINLLETKFNQFEEVCDVVVRMLDELIDLQEYPVKAAANFTLNRRALAIGITNLAAVFAKHKLFYDDPKAIELADQIGEHLQYYCILASANLAKEKGPCAKYSDTTYSQGILPIDRYNKNVDSICKRPLELDWEKLRGIVKEFGMRHSSLTAIAPTESSSVIQNSTNGIEPPRSLLSFKKSKYGLLKQLVPNFKTSKKWYTLAFDIQSNKTVIDIVATFQKWIDQSISMNNYYNYSHYEDGNIPLSVLTKDLIYAYKMGVKNLYYTNTPDGSSDSSSCSSGACSI